MKDHEERLLWAALDWLDREGELRPVPIPERGICGHVHQPTPEGIRRAVFTLHQLLWAEWGRCEAAKHTIPSEAVPEETLQRAVQAMLDIITPAALRVVEETPPGGGDEGGR